MNSTRLLLRPASISRGLGLPAILPRPRQSASLPRAYLSTDDGLERGPKLRKVFSGHPGIEPFDSVKPKFELTSAGLMITPTTFGATRSKNHILPYRWLRDNCICPECRNLDTSQRKVDTFKIKPKIQPQGFQVHYTPNERLVLQWRDGHVSQYPWSFLDHYRKYDSNRDGPRNEDAVTIQTWGSRGPLESTTKQDRRPNDIDYYHVMDKREPGVKDMLGLIRRYGFVSVHGTPYEDAEATQKLLERIAFIRVTHYGGFYDFIPDLAMADTAYTNLALPAHTDTTYFSDPVGLQAFHLLSHTLAPVATQEDGSASTESEATNPTAAGDLGGKSLLVDGFYAANLLKEHHPLAYKILSTVKLPWHASGNEGIAITPDKNYPVFEHDELTGKLHRIRWNNDDRGVVPLGGQYSPEEWYDAAAAWNMILKEQQYWVQLRPGTVLIFDNWRVLHGRSAFTGTRRICGGYINRDDFMSRWRCTHLSPQRVRENLIGI